ncbi:MAG: cryptochrome/photolyase family protein [Pseudomonadota bacterium]|nr:cryptochrome/photolyase family protein [Pseudomonadota bacterium]
MPCLHLTLGSHLFPVELIKSKIKCDSIFMCESKDLAKHFKYHKLKIHFFLTSMRRYNLQLQLEWPVHYYDYESTAEKDQTFFDCLEAHIKKHKTSSISCFYPEDRFFKEKLERFCDQENLELKLLRSPLFLNTPEEFRDYLDSVKKPFLKTFYEQQRQDRRILMNGPDEPQGGRYSFDDENRKKLPQKHPVPDVKTRWKQTIQHQEVDKVIDAYFQDHPGESDQQWYATTTEEAREALQLFLKERFEEFGDYQDALSHKTPFLFHSLLSPYINTGLLPVEEVVNTTIAYAEKNKVPMNSLEGFIRQLIGWREFVFGIDQHFGEDEAQSNFFNHERKLTDDWYKGTTGIKPLDDAITKAVHYGYNHHIERLMVVGNIMLLCEIHPKEAFKWFMEMFIDSADWVMGPNVYGMCLFSDGGIFATKPYICGSNYMIKMGYSSKGDWQETLDGLYWRFIDKHREFFASQYRLSMMVRQLDKMNPERKEKIFKKAAAFLGHHTNNN